MADGFNRLIHNAIMGKFEADIRSGQLELCRHRCKLSGLLPNLAHELFELGFIDAGGSPDIQEALLFLPRTERGRDAIHLGELQRLALVVNWKQQRKLWQTLLAKKGLTGPLTCPGERAAGERPTC